MEFIAVCINSLDGTVFGAHMALDWYTIFNGILVHVIIIDSSIVQ